MTRLWIVRAGRGGERELDAISQGRFMLGFVEVGDLKHLANWEGIFSQVRKAAGSSRSMCRISVAATGFAFAISLAGCDRPAEKVATSAESGDSNNTEVQAPQPLSATTPEEPALPEASADASSVEARFSPAYRACMSSGEAAQGVTFAMADCTSAEIELQDAKLNAVYKQVMSELDEGTRKKLRDAQRAWIKFRDTTCESVSNSGGTIDILNGGSCILDATVRRTMELESWGSG